jgi:hypothetical protein
MVNVMNTSTKTINDWKPETKSLIETLQNHGLTIVSVDNGENETVFSEVTLDTFVEDTMACDEANLYVLAPDGKRKRLYLVYGNSPGELVCDYTVCNEIDAATNEHFKKWNGVTQPRCPSPY